jgi:hypothetical protein
MPFMMQNDNQPHNHRHFHNNILQVMVTILFVVSTHHSETYVPLPLW